MKCLANKKEKRLPIEHDTFENKQILQSSAKFKIGVLELRTIVTLIGVTLIRKT